MKYGYARVSTPDQCLNLQLDALRLYGVDHICEEKISGKNKNKPVLDALIAKLKTGDQLIVWKLDRLGRRTCELIKLQEALEKKNIALISLMLRRIIAFWGDLSLCSRPHFAALRLLYLTLQATVQVAYLIINIIELQFSPCTFLLPIREIFIPFPGFSRYDVPFTNHFLSSFHCFFVGFPCFPLRKCIAIPLFHYATFCFRMSDLLNTSVSGDSSKTVRLVIIVCT